MRTCLKKQQPLARARPVPAWGQVQGLAEADARTDVEDADVVVAEGVETRTSTRACGIACNDAEDAADGEGEATLTCYRPAPAWGRLQVQGMQTRTTAKP